MYYRAAIYIRINSFGIFPKAYIAHLSKNFMNIIDFVCVCVLNSFLA